MVIDVKLSEYSKALRSVTSTLFPIITEVKLKECPTGICRFSGTYTVLLNIIDIIFNKTVYV